MNARSFREREGCRNLRSAFASICRIRSAGGPLKPAFGLSGNVPISIFRKLENLPSVLDFPATNKS